MTDKKPEKKETPVYGKIVDDVRSRIESGQWREGQKLPGERELCNLYGVARGTLKAAFSELQKAGLIDRSGEAELMWKSGMGEGMVWKNRRMNW